MAPTIWIGKSADSTNPVLHEGTESTCFLSYVTQYNSIESVQNNVGIMSNPNSLCRAAYILAALVAACNSSLGIVLHFLIGVT